MVNPSPTKNDAAPRSAVGASASHTPGPWRQYTLTVCALNRHGENRFFAQVSPGHKDNGDWTSREELLANARLIAAAPDLLAACEAILSEYENTEMLKTMRPINLVRKAIKNARGASELQSADAKTEPRAK